MHWSQIPWPKRVHCKGLESMLLHHASFLFLALLLRPQTSTAINLMTPILEDVQRGALCTGSWREDSELSAMRRLQAALAKSEMWPGYASGLSPCECCEHNAHSYPSLPFSFLFSSLLPSPPLPCSPFPFLSFPPFPSPPLLKVFWVFLHNPGKKWHYFTTTIRSRYLYKYFKWF